MNMATYCKSKGMNLEQYEQFTANITSTAQAIYENSKSIHKHDTGVYYPLNDIFNTIGGITEVGYYIMDTMKKLGFEFITESNTILYRV